MILTRDVEAVKFFSFRFSGVARVLCALGKEILLRLLSTKTTEFEVKNRCKNFEEVNILLF